jgi:predicted nucleic acid-binding protein
MKIKGKTFFVDTSAFIVFLHGICNETTKRIFKCGSEGNCKLVTSSRCIDELLFKEMVLLAKAKYKIGNKAVEKLRKNPELVKQIGKEIEGLIPEFLKTYRIEIIEVKKEWVLEIPRIMQKYGLFGNDALIVRAMQSRNIKYILSTDTDFKKVPFIELINAR